MGISEDSLNLAIDLEKEGHEYYMGHAKKAENPMSRTLLENLASMELDHIEAVKKIAEGRPVSSVKLKTRDIEQEVKDVFEDFSKSEREGWIVKDKSIYEHALELETKLAKLYKELEEQSDNQEKKKFFHLLIQEEDMHYEALQNALYYLTDPERWISELEGEVWGWMNT